LTDIAPKILRSQIFDLKPVDDIQIGILQSKCSTKSVSETNFGPVVISAKELGGGAIASRISSLKPTTFCWQL
jgi:hypothetical protein